MKIFSAEDQKIIADAVEEAEKFTSGEIRICIEKTCSDPVLDRAANYFKKLGMDETAKRNGVLIYVAVSNQQFAIIGDVGINRVVPHDFWDETKNAMLKNFKAGEIVQGIITGISMAGQQLKTFFPYDEDDKNELPDSISFMDGK